MIKRPLGIAWPLAALLLAAATPVLEAHPGHSGNDLALTITITDSEIRYDMFMFGGLLGDLLPIGARRIAFNPLTGDFIFKDREDKAQTEEAIAEFFHKRCPLRIDGVPVQPIVRELRLMRSAQAAAAASPAAFPPDVSLVLAYPCKGKSKRVAFVWDLFIRDTTRQMMGQDPTLPLFAQLDAYDESTLIKFTPEEPEHIWHAPTAAAAKDRVEPVIVTAEPTTIAVPIISLALAGVTLIAGIVGLAARKARVAALSISGLGLVAAGVALPMKTTMESPWAEPTPLPSEAEATEIFTALHRNVYRAFDYKRESDIYDVLAESVDGPLLDDVYTEVFQSLILREEGGAVARVHEVDVLDTELLGAGQLETADTLAFQLKARWRVLGVVQHWGHAHQRTNEYVAEYTVAQRDDRWKITGVETLSQERIVQPGDDPTVTPPTGQNPANSPGRPAPNPINVQPEYTPAGRPPQ